MDAKTELRGAIDELRHELDEAPKKKAEKAKKKGGKVVNAPANLKKGEKAPQSDDQVVTEGAAMVLSYLDTLQLDEVEKEEKGAMLVELIGGQVMGTLKVKGKKDGKGASQG